MIDTVGMNHSCQSPVGSRHTSCYQAEIAHVRHDDLRASLDDQAPSRTEGRPSWIRGHNRGGGFACRPCGRMEAH